MPKRPPSNTVSMANTTCDREGDDRTLVRFSITVEPWAPLPAFWVKWARKKILNSALEGLRKRVMGTDDSSEAR